jgi:hypothetical protein
MLEIPRLTTPPVGDLPVSQALREHIKMTPAPRDPFARVAKLGLDLPDVVVATYFGKPALKVNGEMLACMASHKSAEPDTLVVRVDYLERDLRIGNEPEVYYLKPHYRDYACVLTRLSRIDDDSLKDLLESGWGFVKDRKKSKARRARSR